MAQRPWRSSPGFPQIFCPAVNPRACRDWACKMDDVVKQCSSRIIGGLSYFSGVFF